MRISINFWYVAIFLIVALPYTLFSQTAPLLIYPNNGDVLKESFPTFSWTAPVTLVDENIFYAFKLVEVMGDQTPEAAISANPSWYEQPNVTTNLFTYPLSAPFLQKNKRYAWQVSMHYTEVKSGEVLVSKIVLSEVFHFGLHPVDEQKCVGLLYEKTPEQLYIVEANELVFKFDSRLDVQESQMKYQITDLSGNILVSELIQPEKVEGQGYYLIPLSKYATFRKGKKKNDVFILRATDMKSKTYSAKFAKG